MLCYEVEIQYAIYLDIDFQESVLKVPPCWGRAEVKIYNRSNLGTFYARKLKFGVLLTPRPKPLTLC